MEDEELEKLRLELGLEEVLAPEPEPEAEAERDESKLILEWKSAEDSFRCFFYKQRLSISNEAPQPPSSLH